MSFKLLPNKVKCSIEKYNCGKCIVHSFSFSLCESFLLSVFVSNNKIVYCATENIETKFNDVPKYFLLSSESRIPKLLSFQSWNENESELLSFNKQKYFAWYADYY